MRVITRDGTFLEGDFSLEQLATIIERAGIEEPKDEVTAEVEPATPEEAAQAKEHPEELWVDTRPKRPEPEPAKPRGDEVIGGIPDTFDPDKGRSGFQYQYEEK